MVILLNLLKEIDAVFTKKSGAILYRLLYNCKMFRDKFNKSQFYKPKYIIFGGVIFVFFMIFMIEFKHFYKIDFISGCNGIADDLNFKLKKAIL